MFNRLTTSVIFLLFLSSLLLLQLNGCKKEVLPPQSSLDSELAKYEMDSGAHLELTNLQKEELDIADDLEERDNDYNHQKRPVFPFYDGSCRLVFRVYGFDPNLIEGGFTEPCSSSSITLKGFSAPNGQGALLFTQTFPLTGGWQVLNVPQSAYIMFQINQTGIPQENCRFKFVTGTFGWNKAVYEWWNIPYNYSLPVVMGRYAPKDPSTNGGANLYYEYLCAPWCTWSAPVSYLPSDDPWDNPWTTTRFAFYNGQPPATNYLNTSDPRLLNDYFLYEKTDQTLYLYPVEPLGANTYTTKAINWANDPNDLISYSVLGGNGQGAGTFGWGPTGDFQVRPGCNMQYLPNR